MGVGLDIGSRSVKVVELKKEGSGWRLVASGAAAHNIPLPETATDADCAKLAVVIKKLVKDAGISSHHVSLALPEPLVFTRSIKFPLLTDQELALAIKWEAEQYIPIPASEAIIQHQVISRKETGTPAEITVLMVAAPRTLVEKYIKLISASGLTLAGVETELLALTRALAPDNRAAILVDFGARSTDLAIVVNSQLCFSRSVSTAGDALTRAVAQSLGIEDIQAEAYKKAYGLSPTQLEGKIMEALNPVFKVITDEIKKAAQFYRGEQGGEMPSQIVLSGGAAGMPEIMNFLSRSLNMEVVLGNPFTRVAADPEAARVIASYAPIYSIAVGLAERDD